MKIVFNLGIITLYAENDEEKEFLDKVGKEGLRNFGSGSSNVLALPSEAGLKQIHLTEDQINMITYIFGLNRERMFELYGKEEAQALLFTFIPRSELLGEPET